MIREEINLFVNYGFARYIMANLPKSCATKNIHCQVRHNYKLGDSTSISVLLAGHDGDKIMEIINMLNSLSNSEYIDEIKEEELIKNEP